jgi:hypothetical protein
MTNRSPRSGLRLRRLLCGKAAPFRFLKPPTNFLRAAGRHSLPGGAEEEKMSAMDRKGRAFPHSRGRSPIKHHDCSLIWIALGKPYPYNQCA